MSQTLENFRAAIRTPDWILALRHANGLSMPEMLEGLSGLSSNQLADIDAQLVQVAHELDIPRLKFAILTIRNRRVPDSSELPILTEARRKDEQDFAPQIREAQRFLSRATGTVQRGKRIPLCFVWSNSASHETLSARYVAKAQELLHKHDATLHLDIQPMRHFTAAQLGGSMQFNEEENRYEMDACRSVEGAEELAEAATLQSDGRIVVVWFVPGQVMSYSFNKPTPVPATTGFAGKYCKSNSTNRRFCLIDCTTPSKDGVTLLHEIGHAVGLEHRFEKVRNFMSYGTDRTEIDSDQLKALRNAAK